MSKLTSLLLPAVLVFTQPSHAEDCPKLVRDGLRLVLVTTATMNSASAKMRTFSRSAADMQWKETTGAEPAVVGQAGLAWGYSFSGFKRIGESEKREGDKRTPAGFFEVGPSFGFEDSNLPNYIKIKGGETVCVEDASSPFYNTITKRSLLSDTVRVDDMRRTPLYRRGIFIAYPTDRAARRGSCIFIHIWQRGDRGTAGCVGLPAARVEMLQEFSRTGAVLAVLPELAFDRLSRCLPGISQLATD